ncbi:MAG: hypothetical protein K8U57_29910 [Planctomycetes bacterium]|nr:hypothetical protein [Planctomycetota bacterium]
MTNLHERLTQAFIEVFGASIPWFGGGGPGHHGVQLEYVADDGSEVDLVLTFRSGVRYCCFESVCRFDERSARAWATVREYMNRQGLEDLPLPVIRKFRGVIEIGAVVTPDRIKPAYVWDKHQEYEKGPWLPVIADIREK